MPRNFEAIHSNQAIATAFRDASEEVISTLPDGTSLKIVGKSDKSTWSDKPESFETDSDPKVRGPYEGSRVLWTPTTANEVARWSVAPEGEESALVRVAGGMQRIFARAANKKVRDSNKISTEFGGFKDVSNLELAYAVHGEPLNYGALAERLVVASLPESVRPSDEEMQTLVEAGAVYLGQCVVIGAIACRALGEIED